MWRYKSAITCIELNNLTQNCMSENVKIENEAYNENYFPQIPSLGISFPWSRNIKGTKQHDARVLVVVKIYFIVL